MNAIEEIQVESQAAGDFAKIMTSRLAIDKPPSRDSQSSAKRLNINEENVKSGLAQLVLTLIKLIHELLEKQAIRRIDSESLTDEQVERLGLTLMKQSEEIERLRLAFGLDEDDLNLDLGPLGKLL